MRENIMNFDSLNLVISFYNLLILVLLHLTYYIDFFLEHPLTVDGFLPFGNMNRSHISIFFKDSMSSSMALF